MVSIIRVIKTNGRVFKFLRFENIETVQHSLHINGNINAYTLEFFGTRVSEFLRNNFH
jgi:hypothetical protein